MEASQAMLYVLEATQGSLVQKQMLKTVMGAISSYPSHKGRAHQTVPVMELNHRMLGCCCDTATSARILWSPLRIKECLEQHTNPVKTGGSINGG